MNPSKISRTCLSLIALTTLSLSLVSSSHADIIYNFLDHPSYQVDGANEWSVSGTIAVNDNTYDTAPTGKELSLSDFVAWTITVTKIAGTGTLNDPVSATWTADTGDTDTGNFDYDDLGIFGTPTELRVFTNGSKEDVQFKSVNPLKVNIHFHDNSTAANRKYDGGINSNNEWRTDDTSPALSASDSTGFTIAAIPEPSSFMLMAIGLAASYFRRRQKV